MTNNNDDLSVHICFNPGEHKDTGDAIDNIIDRLRVMTVADSAERIYATMSEAADEIERLRIERDSYKQIASDIALSIYMTSDRNSRPTRMNIALDAYEKQKRMNRE